MEINLIASTNGMKTGKEFLRFARDAARKCYSAKPYSEIVLEEDKTNLAERVIKSGHHSVTGHTFLTLELRDIPKFGAMLLNNEKLMNTSEQSARYTVMGKVPQKELYDNWLGIFETEISERYPDLDKQKVKKLAQENARYLTSVFTPTSMFHTLDFRQLNNIMHYFHQDITSLPQTDFNQRVRDFMKDFNRQLSHLFVGDLFYDRRDGASIFAKRKKFPNEFGEMYSISYLASLACLAQAHRHRTLNYEMQLITEEYIKEVINKNLFFVPPIIWENPSLVEEWNSDMRSVIESGDFPQGMLVDIHEYGGYKEFLMKCGERLCGHAQLEIMRLTEDTLQKYIKALDGNNGYSDVFNALMAYSNGPRCMHPDLICRGRCDWGPEGALERLI